MYATRSSSSECQKPEISEFQRFKVPKCFGTLDLYCRRSATEHRSLVSSTTKLLICRFPISRLVTTAPDRKGLSLALNSSESPSKNRENGVIRPIWRTSGRYDVQRSPLSRVRRVKNRSPAERDVNTAAEPFGVFPIPIISSRAIIIMPIIGLVI